jgi:GcrA cell cycle regulator
MPRWGNSQCFVSPWTLPILDRFRSLLSEELSFGQAATKLNAEFGTVFTRSACIGKAFREGIRIADSRRRSPDQGWRKPAVKTKRASPTRPATIPATPESDLMIPHEQRKQFMDLEPADCRYPVGHVGEPGFFFCGGQVVDGLCYCAAHARVCYEPARPRKLDGIQPFRRAA